jgi:hypothetical protein
MVTFRLHTVFATYYLSETSQLTPHVALCAWCTGYFDKVNWEVYKKGRSLLLFFSEMGCPSHCIAMMNTTVFIEQKNSVLQKSVWEALLKITDRKGSQQRWAIEKKEKIWSAFASTCQTPVSTPSAPVVEIPCNRPQTVAPNIQSRTLVLQL